MKKYSLSLLIIASLFFITSCDKDFLDVEPARAISADQLSTSPAGSQGILSGIYANLRTFGIGGTTFHIDYGHKGITAGLDMMGHDVSQSVFHWYGFYLAYDGRVQTSSRARLIWTTYYSQIFNANSIINAIDPATDNPDLQAILGQALALRAFCYHQLVRIYAPTYIGNESSAGIPIVFGTETEGQPRASIADVYAQMAIDIEAAIPLLANFSRATKQEVSQQVAQGFAAQIYLDMGEWTKAAAMANAARAGYAPMSADAYVGEGFADISNAEWMWGADIDNESSGIYASFFSHFGSYNPGYAGILGAYKVIDKRLYEAIPSDDIRKQVFIGPDGSGDIAPYANAKFYDATFFEADYVYMRAAEMYLIEAEALARSGNSSGAASVLQELVSTRQPSYTQSTSSGDALVNEIYLQRRIELWGEGTSFFDLKRMKLPLERDYEGSNHLASGRFNLPANSNEFVFQLPEIEIQANAAISEADQNP